MLSHFSGVVIMTLADRTAAESGVVSPVSSTRRWSVGPIRRRDQSSTRSRTRAFIGAIYTTFAPGRDFKRPLILDSVVNAAYHIANSAATVFPLPVGAPIRTFWFV